MQSRRSSFVFFPRFSDTSRSSAAAASGVASVLPQRAAQRWAAVSHVKSRAHPFASIAACSLPHSVAGLLALDAMSAASWRTAAAPVPEQSTGHSRARSSAGEQRLPAQRSSPRSRSWTSAHSAESPLAPPVTYRQSALGSW